MAGAVLCGPLRSQALSQPQIITDFFSWSWRQGQCLLLGSWAQPWGPEVRLNQLHIYVPHWEPGSQRDRPPAHCRGLLCFAVYFVVERAGFGFSMFLFLPCSTFMYAARNPPCLLTAAQEGFRDVYRFFSSLTFPCGCWGLLLR